MPASSPHPMTVQRSPTGFVLRDPVLRALVGADVLPLPFTPEADPADVLAHLRRLNPTRTVRFDAAPCRDAHLPPVPRTECPVPP